MKQNKKVYLAMSPFIENWGPSIVLLLISSLIIILCGEFGKLISLYSALLYSWSFIELLFYKKLFKKKKTYIVFTILVLVSSSVFIFFWFSWQFIIILATAVSLFVLKTKLFPNIFLIKF